MNNEPGEAIPQRQVIKLFAIYTTVVLTLFFATIMTSLYIVFSDYYGFALPIAIVGFGIVFSCGKWLPSVVGKMVRE